MKISPSFAVGLPISSGFTFPDPLQVNASTGGGLGFASIVRGQAVTVTQFQVSINQFGSNLFANFGNFPYGLSLFARLDTSRATFTPTPTGTTVTGVRATLVGFAAQALNQALGTDAFSSGSQFATLTIKTKES